ncbi:MAG: hypothetical protein AAGL89_15095 [Pseudomonadota bacterium]
MKRRGFLQLLSGALTAPFMPHASLATATKAAPSAAALHGAVYFAKSRVNFSVFTLAQGLGVPMEQAERLMVHMSKRGMIGPLQSGNAISGRWATSHLWRKPATSAAAAKAIAKAQRADAEDQAPSHDKQGAEPWADMRPVLRHLHSLCRTRGMDLHPRCAALTT